MKNYCIGRVYVDNFVEIFALIISVLNLFLMIFVIVKLLNKNSDNSFFELDKKTDRLSAEISANNKNVLDLLARQNETIVNEISALGNGVRDTLEKQQNTVDRRLLKLESDFDRINTNVLSSLESMRKANTESLDRINNTVNEKLQKTLDDRITKSFETVNKRLTEVYQGLGEMKTVAAGVTDLKNVLSNVKTRGILGEIQLEGILREILAPEQFEVQAQIKPGGSERVDFAVKLPGAEEGKTVYLSIDSKFPGDTYQNLLLAYDSDSAENIKQKRRILETEIKRCAKSISDKYILPPYTTDFAVMFLPFEGLYAEVVNMGLVEVLQHDYKVNIAGPSTMAAMLNSLQMGFRTLAIQKKSSEVWSILEGAKKEFENFESVLNAARNRLKQADDELEKLIGTRTRAINRKLKGVTANKSDELDILQ